MSGVFKSASELLLKCPAPPTGATLPAERAVITLTPLDGRSIYSQVTRPVDPSGTLNFSAVTPGKYLILPQAGPGFYPISVLLGGQEVLGKPVDLFPGSALRVTYKAATGSVQGTVENCNGATVVLIPRDVRTLAFGRVAICKSDGTFDMSGVAPGDLFCRGVLWAVSAECQRRCLFGIARENRCHRNPRVDGTDCRVGTVEAEPRA